MSNEPLSPEVAQFVVRHIDSVPHLEALLILWESQAAWNAGQMSARIYLPEARSHGVLQDLRRAGLACSEDGASFRFDTRWPDAGSLMPQVVRAWQREVIRVTTLIHDKASSSVREFARAFDFKKDR